MDFVTDLPKSEGQTIILTVADRFSKSLRLILLPVLPTAFEMAEILFHQVFRFYGIPETIVSDRGPQLTSHVWAGFMEKLGVIVYHLDIICKSMDRCREPTRRSVVF